jgi:hypothetical protein
VVAIVGLLVLMVNPVGGGVVLLFDLVIVMSALFTTPNSITAWQTGASKGELRTGRLLEPLEGEGFRVLHDRKMPGSRANIDHIVAGRAVRSDAVRAYARIVVQKRRDAVDVKRGAGSWTRSTAVQTRHPSVE